MAFGLILFLAATLASSLPLESPPRARALQSGALAFTGAFSQPAAQPLYANTTYTVTWTSSGATVQGGAVAVQLLTSPALTLAAVLATGVSALAAQATFTLPVAPAYGAYVIALKSLADASVSCATAPLQVSGGALSLAAPAGGEVFVLVGQAILVNISAAGGNILGANVIVQLIYYG